MLHDEFNKKPYIRFLRPRMFGRGRKCWGELFLDGVCDPSLIIPQEGMYMKKHDNFGNPLTPFRGREIPWGDLLSKIKPKA